MTHDDQHDQNGARIVIDRLFAREAGRARATVQRTSGSVRWLAVVVIACWLVGDVASKLASAQDARIERHLAAGEFSIAKKLAAELPAEQRNQALIQIATKQARSGNTVSAMSTALAALPSVVSGANSSGAHPVSASMKPSPIGAKGGGAMADFSSLMELIQTTVVPDTWEALGGPSTMSPYPAGVLVDPQGMICDTQLSPLANGLQQLKIDSLREPAATTGQRSPDDWIRAAQLRKVSLGRLQRELARCAVSGFEPSEAMRFLAGISRIEYVFFQAETSDVIVAGPVGGIRIGADNTPVDVQTGQAPLTLDLLGFALHGAAEQRKFGCTIEPTPAGIIAAKTVTDSIASGKLPAAAAKDKLADALGRQTVTVFGTPGDSAMAMLMVQADRHMKQLALDQHPMPRGVSNYLDFVKATLAQEGGPGGFLRLWFAPQPVRVRCDAQQVAFELQGHPLQLMCESELADAQGQRHRAPIDIRAAKFAKHFNEHYQDIAQQYPIYDRLRGLFHAAAVAQLVCSQLDVSQREQTLGLLLHPDAWAQQVPHAPRQTDSLVVYRTYRQGNIKHSVLVASGGVEIDPAAMLLQSPQIYPTLTSVRQANATTPHRQDLWWWD